MGKADIVTKAYMRENRVFADAFNFMVYNGEPVIDSGQLKELDVTELTTELITELTVPEFMENRSKGRMKTGDLQSETEGVKSKTAKSAGKKKRSHQSFQSEAVQKYRDLLKSCVIMQDGRAAYVLLGIENQTDVHYAMPVRNMVYDALQYARQVGEVSSSHRKGRLGVSVKESVTEEAVSGDTAMSEDTAVAEYAVRGKDRKRVSRGEYLSGFYRDDKLIPVITLVVHFGADNWDGPLSLHDMFSVKDEKLLNFVQNYKIHLIDPSQLGEQDLVKFQTSLREVLGYIKYSKDKKKLKEFIQDNPRMHLPREAAQVIQTLTNTNIVIPEDEEEIDMCQAIDEMLKDSREEGEATGWKKCITAMYKSGMTLQQIAGIVGQSPEDVEKLLV